MFSFDQIKALIELVASQRLQGVEVESGEFRLKIDGHRTVTVEPAAGITEGEYTPTSAPVVETSPEPGDGLPADAHIITSPIVGTFYAAPSPDSPSYVEVGDRVKVGQVLCIVEAMKLMNEIEADADGVVLEIFPKNAQPVEYGERLFALRAT